jgi:large subunit ribosomal protein L21|tara:strand:+ start:394 stop:909 length:516 start_codon:yes stop_codon:yes gene_type:complete
MLAIFKTGGKQYYVKLGQILKVEKIEGKKGDSLSFNDVLAISDGSDNTIGTPLVKGASIEAKILDQIRDKKVIVFKKRRRKNYRLTQGHRQYLTVLKIESILNGTKKISIPKTSKKHKEIKSNEVNDSISKKVGVKVEKKSVVKKATPKKIAKKKKITKKTVSKKTIKSKK